MSPGFVVKYIQKKKKGKNNMSRSEKNGLSFFSFDTDFFDGIVIKLLKARFGSDGIVSYLYILCQIYKEGFYVKADEDFFFIMADDTGIKPDTIGQIVSFLCKRSLLDGKLFASDKVLTSHGIQKLYQLCMRSRQLHRDVKVEQKYWVLNEEDTQPFIKFTQNQSISGRKDDSSPKKDDNSRKNLSKESKGKESKEKENICAGVIEYLNLKAGTKYNLSGAQSLKLIEQRLKEGYTFENFKEVIEKKCNEWKGEEYEKYLRPQTLFGDKFETYLNENIIRKKAEPRTKFVNFGERTGNYSDVEKQKLAEMMELAKNL